MRLVNSSPEMVNHSLLSIQQTVSSDYDIDIGEQEAGPTLTELLNKIYHLPQVAPVDFKIQELKSSVRSACCHAYR
jgi:hypothetical protein